MRTNGQTDEHHKNRTNDLVVLKFEKKLNVIELVGCR